MSHTWQDLSKIGEVLEELVDKSLTSSERNLIESFSDQHSRRGSLSERQLEVLEEIWVRY